MSPFLLVLLLRLGGVGLIALSAFHVVLWRAFAWGEEIARLSPLNARVFVVHTGYLVFVLLGLGLLSLCRPDLLLAPGELQRLLLGFIVAFWLARLLLQPLVYDRVIPPGWARHPAVRAGSYLLWAVYALIYGAALARQWGIAPFDIHSHRAWLRVAIALVWLVFGLLFKALDAVPRHRQIVARVVGERYAGAVTQLVAIGEVAIGLWMLIGRALVPCVALQTLLIAAMNACELRWARDLLLSPAAMICANLLLLALGWYVAIG